MTKTRKLGLVALATGGLLLAGAGVASADTLPGAPQSSILDTLTRGLPLPGLGTNAIPGLDGVDVPLQVPGLPATEDVTG